MRRVTDVLLLWTLLVLVGSAAGLLLPPTRRTGRRYIVQLDTPALCEAVPCTPGHAHAQRDATWPGASTRAAAAHHARLRAQHTALAQVLPPGITVATLGTERGAVEARFTTFVNAVAGLCRPSALCFLFSCTRGCGCCCGLCAAQGGRSSPSSFPCTSLSLVGGEKKAVRTWRKVVERERFPAPAQQQQRVQTRSGKKQEKKKPKDNRRTSTLAEFHRLPPTFSLRGQ